MKKILLLVVLAVSACTTIFGQDRVQKAFNHINFEINKMETIDRQMKALGDKLGVNRNGRPVEERDYQTGITSIKRYNEVASIYCTNLWIEIDGSSVTLYTPSGDGFASYTIDRRNYGYFTAASNVVCGNYKNVTVKVTNNSDKTVIRFYVGSEQVIKAFWINQERVNLNKYPKYQRRKHFTR